MRPYVMFIIFLISEGKIYLYFIFGNVNKTNRKPHNAILLFTSSYYLTISWKCQGKYWKNMYVQFHFVNGNVKKKGNIGKT